jgi:hypothetical protein
MRNPGEIHRLVPSLSLETVAVQAAMALNQCSTPSRVHPSSHVGTGHVCVSIGVPGQPSRLTFFTLKKNREGKALGLAQAKIRHPGRSDVAANPHGMLKIPVQVIRSIVQSRIAEIGCYGIDWRFRVQARMATAATQSLNQQFGLGGGCPEAGDRRPQKPE